MKRIAQIISMLALVGTIVPPCLFFADKITLPSMQQLLLVATIVWLVATPFWMEHKTS